MPKLSVYFVRMSLIYMGIGFLLGALILQHKGIPSFAWAWHLLDPHIVMMVLGWTLQFVMGIGVWILPRFSHRAHRYGQESLGWTSFYLFNGGVLVRVFIAPPYVFLGDMLVLLGIVCYVVMMLPRIKPLIVSSNEITAKGAKNESH